MDKKWWTLLAVGLGTFMLLLDITIVVVAQPAIQVSLHAALSGLAQDPLMLIVCRSAQGVGGAIMFAVSLAMLGHSFRGKDRGVAFGVWGAIAGVATALGPVLGGVLTTYWSWRGIFLVNLPVGVFAIAVTAWRVPESRSPRPEPPDWAGFATLTAGLVGLVYGLIRAGEYAWSDPGVIACLAIGAAALAAFIAVESRTAHPLFDLSLLRTPTFGGGSIAAFAMNGSLFAMLLYLVLYLQDILGYSALGAGVRLAIISGAQLVTAAIAGRLSEHVPVRWLIGPGLMLVGIGLFLMTGLSGGSSWTHLIPGFVVAGLGAGLVNPPLASTAIGVVPPRRAGMASGVNSTFRQIGIATGIAALGSIFTAGMERNLSASRTAAAAGPAGHIVATVKQGRIGELLAGLPPAARGRVAIALRGGFAAGLNDALIVTGALALAGAVCALALIRNKDFVRRQDTDASATAAEGARSR
jgi:EmrB/QacA subfamily drug resistance transporter